MCKELENVTSKEWEETRAEISRIKSLQARWGGGLSVLMALVVMVGGGLINSFCRVSDTVNKNRESNMRLQEQSKAIVNTLERLADEDKRVEISRKADMLDLKGWVREGRESDARIQQIGTLQLERTIEELKSEIAKIRNERDP